MKISFPKLTESISFSVAETTMYYSISHKNKINCVSNNNSVNENAKTVSFQNTHTKTITKNKNVQNDVKLKLKNAPCLACGQKFITNLDAHASDVQIKVRCMTIQNVRDLMRKFRGTTSMEYCLSDKFQYCKGCTKMLDDLSLLNDEQDYIHQKIDRKLESFIYKVTRKRAPQMNAETNKFIPFKKKLIHCYYTTVATNKAHAAHTSNIYSAHSVDTQTDPKTSKHDVYGQETSSTARNHMVTRARTKEVAKSYPMNFDQDSTPGSKNTHKDNSIFQICCRNKHKTDRDGDLEVHRSVKPIKTGSITLPTTLSPMLILTRIDDDQCTNGKSEIQTDVFTATKSTNHDKYLQKAKDSPTTSAGKQSPKSVCLNPCKHKEAVDTWMHSVRHTTKTSYNNLTTQIKNQKKELVTNGKAKKGNKGKFMKTRRRTNSIKCNKVDLNDSKKHTNDFKIFKCDHCERSFPRLNNLMCHMRVHTRKACEKVNSHSEINSQPIPDVEILNVKRLRKPRFQDLYPPALERISCPSTHPTRHNGNMNHVKREQRDHNHQQSANDDNYGNPPNLELKQELSVQLNVS